MESSQVESKCLTSAPWNLPELKQTALIALISTAVCSFAVHGFLFTNVCIGILGQYLAKTYLETKHRPIYILAETNEENPDDAKMD